MLVDGPIQVAPLAPDPDVGLVDAHRPAVGLAERAQPALDQRRVGQHPAVHGAVVDLEDVLEEQLLDVAIAQRVAEVPGDRLPISSASKWRSLKSSFDRRFSLAAMADRIMETSEREAANSVGVANEPSTPEIATGPPRMPVLLPC